MLKKFFLTTLIIVGGHISIGQNAPITIKGQVIDSLDNEPLSFASVILKEHKIGTVTDTTGVFNLSLSKSIEKDTLIFSFLGYNSLKIPIDTDESENIIHVKMKARSVVLSDVVVSPTSPTDYIDRAMEHASENYQYKPYYLLSYFENNFYEDKRPLAGNQTVFKTYHQEDMTTADSEPIEEHQLLLIKEREDKEKLIFMRKNIKKKIEKERGSENNEEDSSIKMTPLFVPIQNASLPFLNKEYYKRFRYTIRESCARRNLIIIDFETKRPFSYKYLKSRGKGTLYIDCKNYAIIKLDIDMDLSLSFLLKSLLFVGLNKLKVNDIKLIGSIEYKAYGDLWYPSTLSLTGSGKATKVKWFSKNERATFEFSSTTLVNKIITENVTKIPDDKQFSFKKLNIQNDENISWEDVVSVKHELYKKN